MKADFLIVLVILLAVSKATKFSPIHASYKGHENEEPEMIPSVLKEEVPASADALGEVQEGCDFCTDYMLSDCICEDVNFCKSKSCYVPDKCSTKHCDENEEEEETPVTTNTVGEVQEGCDFCTDSMLSDCICEDVNFCKSKSCYVPDKCSTKHCDENEEEEEEEETPETTNTAGEVQEGYGNDKEEEEEDAPVTTNTAGEAAGRSSEGIRV